MFRNIWDKGDFVMGDWVDGWLSLRWSVLYLLIYLLIYQQYLHKQNKKLYLTHSFLMHPFSNPWKHLKTVRFSDVFRRQRKGALGTNRLIANLYLLKSDVDSEFSQTKKTELSSNTSLTYDAGPYHIETSPLIRRANPWTGFYMIGTSIMKELKPLFIFVKISISGIRLYCMHPWYYFKYTIYPQKSRKKSC